MNTQNSTKLKDIATSFLGILGLVLLLAVAWIAVENPAFAASQTDSRPTEEARYKTYTFFTATTTSATSTSDGTPGMDIKGATGVTLYFSRADSGGNTGTSTFSVQVSPDEGTTWYNFSKLISNTTNTSSQDLTRVASVDIVAATSSTMVSMDLENDAFSRVRCIVVEGTDGSHTCSASAEF